MSDLDKEQLQEGISKILPNDNSGFLGVKVLTTSKDATQRGNEPGVWQENSTMVEFNKARVLQQTQRTAAFECLTMRIDQGHHCLVVGAGCDAHRQALLRALQGDHSQLLTHGIQRSPRPHSQITHVGGRVYVKPGSSSLWDLLIFPHDKTQSIRRGIREPQLAAVLRFMNFEFLLQRASDDWGRVIDWTKILGPGELYAVAICRLLYHSPRFAILDDALDCLRADQVRQLFAAARMHQITMLVLADTDPFDDRVKKTGAESGSQQGSAYLTCIEEFTRVLRVTADSAWEFCEFGYAAQRPAFETTEPMKFIWVSVEDDASRREHQRRLSRRTSTLSQCSTTERRWLMSQEPSSSLAATQASSPAGIETLASRRQSRALSPPLTARSSVSDFAASAAALDSTRMMTIDSALSKYAAAAATAASISATVSGLPGSGSGSGNNINGPKTLKRRPLGGSRMFSAPIEQAEDAEQLPTAQDLQATNKIELNQETNQEISSKDGVKAYDDDEEEFVASADTLTEASKVAINTVAVAEALDKDMQEIEPASAPTSPAANKPYGERNPYARAPRNYKRSSRSSFSSTQRTPPPSALSNPLAAEVFVAPQIDQEDVLRRPFSRMTNPEVASDLAEPVRRRSSRSYSRSSPAPSRQQQLQQPRSGRLGNSRIPRPPTSSSVSTASSRSTAYSGSMSQVHVVTVDELALALDNL